MDRPRAGVNIQVKSVSGANRQPNGARSGMQLPATGNDSVGADVTATRACAQSAFDAAQMDSARTALDIHVARAVNLSFAIRL